MSVLGLIALIVLAVLAGYFAPRLGSPWDKIVYGVIVLLCVLGILSLFGFLGNTVVIR